MSVNTQDMKIVHRVLRRESRLLVELVAAVAPGDTARAKVIADHFRVYRLGLHNHHEGEDELLWPPLLSRVDLEADIVLRMEAQHERIAATLTRLDAAVPAWEATAGADERDTLVAALAEHRAVLLEHLDDEEATLPPARGQAHHRAGVGLPGRPPGEQHAQAHPAHALRRRPGGREPGRARHAPVRGLPAPVRGIWHVIGRPRYARHIRR